MRRAPALLLAAALAGLLDTAGCSGGGGGGDGGGTATVQGTLRDDATLEPISGATITSGADSTTTAANGTFTLLTTSGSRTIIIVASGYERAEISEMLTQGVNDLGTRYLRPVLLAGRGAARGTVRRAGAAAAGAIVRSGSARAVSKADGTFAIYNLEAGQRAITAVSSDAQAVGSSPVTIEAGATATGITIDLSLAPPPPPIL